MKTKSLVIIAFILLIGLNFLVLFQYKQLQKENQYLALVNAQYGSIKLGESEVLKHNLIIQQLSEAISCENLELKTPDTRENISFTKLIQNEPKLFFRFKEASCDACIQSTIEFLSDLSKSMPDIEIIILSGYANVRQFQAYAQSNQSKQFKVYNINEIPFTADQQDQPYLFIVTPDNLIRNVFITTKEDDRLTQEYLNAIMHRYWHHAIHDHHDCCDHHH